jgi:hypothetical protein
MTFDMEAILDSKRWLRLHLAALPIGEKLRMLDELREREISIRESAIMRDGSGISKSRLNSKRGKGAPRTQAEPEALASIENFGAIEL